MKPTVVTLHWQRFESLTEARRTFGMASCIYVQADRNGSAVRVGKASRGLHARYRGGTGWAIDAAMHQSGNIVYVAPVDEFHIDKVEATLIWNHRGALRYNNVGKRISPTVLVSLVHRGEPPAFPT